MIPMIMPKSMLTVTVKVTKNKICESETLLGSEMLSMKSVSDQSMLVKSRHAPSVVQMLLTTTTIFCCGFLLGVVLA
jgi:hypothetical protein